MVVGGKQGQWLERVVVQVFCNGLRNAHAIIGRRPPAYFIKQDQAPL